MGKGCRGKGKGEERKGKGEKMNCIFTKKINKRWY